MAATQQQIPAQPPAIPGQGGPGGVPVPAPFHSASLYVGDLAAEVTEALLFDIFNAVGPVASIRVCRDAVTKRSLGYAYVNFHNVQDAERALDTMNYTPIKGRPCRIMWSQRDPSLRKTGAGNVFVKNLDPSIDNKALYDTFSLFGNILSCKVVTKNNGQSCGYGFVHYETVEAAEEAIRKINGMLIAGKEVYVGHFKRRSERPAPNSWTNVFVKNFPEEWDEAQLTEAFSKFGPITSVAVMKDGDGKARGFGFVNFETHDAAMGACEALNDKPLDPEDETAKHLFVGRAQKKAERERDLREKFEKMKQERISKYQGVNLYVKNIADDVDDDKLREIFAAYGTITSCRVMKDTEKGTSRGFAFVCFSSAEEATKAVTEQNNKMVGAKPMYVALAQRKEVRREQLRAQHAQRQPAMGRGGPMMGQPQMYGAPIFYQGAPMPNARQGGFMYPQQMMPRGLPQQRGPMPGYGRGYPNMPGGAYPFPQNQMMGGRGGNNRGNRRNGPGPRNMNHRGGPHRGNMKYNNNRNQQAPQQQQQPMMQQQAPQMAQPQQAQAQPQQEPLTPAVLASASAEQQKNMIGERLYPLVSQLQPELAGKITGMLLEMDNTELLHLIESPDALQSKIQEAMQVLDAHNQQAATADDDAEK